MTKFCILAVGPWYPVTAFTFFVSAFERIGCKIVRGGPAYSDHMGLKWDDLPLVDLKFAREEKRWNLNGFVDWCTLHHGAPDLLFVSEENYQTDIVPTKKVPSVLWSADSWPNCYERANLYQCTLNYINQPLGNRFHPRETEDPRWRFLPGAAAPWVHCNLNLERDFDFCLLASSYGKRPELCQGLTDRGFKVWSGQAITKTYVEAYNRSLCTYHNPGYSEVKWRFFEAAAMGCVNISGESNLFFQLNYIPWVHYVPIETPYEDEWPETDSLAITVSDLKKKLSILKDIARSARLHTLTNHSYLNRVKTIFSDLGMAEMVAKADDAIGKMLEEYY